jgi:DNA polymerase-3 subunit alpha
VRGARPLAAVSGATAMELTADIASVDALRELQIELQAAQGERPTGMSEVVVRLALGDGGQVHVRLGCNFVLNGELAERLAAVDGIAKVALVPLKKRGNLKLVA